MESLEGVEPLLATSHPISVAPLLLSHGLSSTVERMIANAALGFAGNTIDYRTATEFGLVLIAKTVGAITLLSLFSKAAAKRF